jgi:8-oxo-dGTP pyrophosphatase MutT (NUDIX family)
MDDETTTEPSTDGQGGTHPPIEYLGGGVELSDRFATIRRERVRFPNGAVGTHWVITSGEGHPGVVILPWRDGKVGLIRSYRYPIGRHVWAIPRGRATSADSRAEAARELGEETRADQVELITLDMAHTDTGLLDTEVRFFLARLAPGCPFHADGTEEIDAMRWASPDEIKAMIRSGEMTDQFTIVALAMAEWSGHLV